MFSFRAKFGCLVTALFILLTIRAGAQTSSASNPLSGRENNPYSRFGMGELWDGNSTELKGMADITAPFASPTELNPDNPASYSFLLRTTMEGGVMLSTRVVAGDGLSYTTGTMTPAYLMIGMPVGKNGGLSFGLRPYTRTYYSLADTVTNSPIGSAERYYSGQGNLSFAYLGYARRFGDFSIGLNVNYMFGQILNSTNLIPIDTNSFNRSNIALFANNINVGGLFWKAGLQYRHKLADSNYTIRIGGTLTLAQNLYENLTTYQASIYYFGDTTVNDTTYNPGLLTGKMKMPTSFSFGAMLEKNELWNVGINYAATLWNTFKSTPDSNLTVNIANRSDRLSIGAQYSPMPAKLHKHFTNLSYRFGAYYGNSYLNIGGYQLPEYGLTAGASIHFKATHFSWVNMHTAIEVGKLASSQAGVVQQTYFRWSLGLSYNDKWFLPRKYD